MHSNDKRKRNSIYGIFINKRTNKKLAYYPCPKNANTSAKLFFLKHLGIENEFVFIGDDIPNYMQKEIDFNKKKNLVNFLPCKQPFSKVDVDLKCCIIRNPIDRFISSYKNRILFHKDINFIDHSIDMVLDKLESNLFENKHFLLQSFSLGNNISYYSFYADVKNIKPFEEAINEFFEKKVSFPKLQTGGNEFQINLNSSQINRIRKIYAKDFELINFNK